MRNQRPDQPMLRKPQRLPGTRRPAIFTVMFGIVRPCRHRLRGPLYGEWMAHLCGLCLTLRDLHGQFARLVTNYDGLLVSVLTEAQDPAAAVHRTAGPCPLRGFRRADVLDSAASGAQLAAAVSLVLAAGKIRDHIEDRDGAFARRMVAAGAGLTAERWRAAAEQVGATIGFDTSALTDAVGRQAAIERSSGATLAEVTEPTETAVSAAFAHTAVLAGQPGNARPLAEAGRSFGRIAHLLDAVEDLPADRAAGSYNPLLATGTTRTKARETCGMALTELRTAVADLDLRRPTLTESLLVREVGIAVDRVFAEIEGGPAAGLGGWRVPGDRPGMPLVGPCRPGRRRRRSRGPRPGNDSCCDGCCEGCCDACDGCDCSGCDCSC